MNIVDAAAQAGRVLRWRMTRIAAVFGLSLAALVSVAVAPAPAQAAARFQLQEATITDIQSAILHRQLTATQLVHLYLQRVKAYNGTCVREPKGILGPVETIPNAGQVNALQTLNLRPAARRQMGFDERKARSVTDAADADPSMPDALETAADLDRQFAKTGRLVGPLHGVVMSIKDQYDTRDMRTTSGADARYANDRPPRDSTFVARLRAAGAIILGKANMGEYAAGYRSAFGGTFCNPYDTERSPGGSSGGSGSSVATNMVTCSIGEESGPSIRSPAKNNNVVGLAPTQELVSRDGMIYASYMNDRVGPLCRTVADAAKVLDVIAGYDPRDELTVFARGRVPAAGYASAAATSAGKGAKPLAGVRIGVVREYMDPALFTAADAESIQIIERQLPVLQSLGATVVDPGPGGDLMSACLAKYAPQAHNAAFTAQHPRQFPYTYAGKPASDHALQLATLAREPSSLKALGGEAPTLRGIGPEETSGERKFMMERYLQARGDTAIRSIHDLLEKSSFFAAGGAQSGFQDKRQMLETTDKDWSLDLGARLQARFTLQQSVLQCLSELQLDALTYPTGNIPAGKIGRPNEPTVNGRQNNAWTLLGAHGFAAITVPAGFTTQVYDRIADPKASGGTRLEGPIKAQLPVGIDFLVRPFDEALMVRIAAAYESATHHRRVPAGYGPVPGEL